MELNKRETTSYQYDEVLVNQEVQHPITKTRWVAQIRYSRRKKQVRLSNIQGDYSREMELFFAIHLLYKQRDEVVESVVFSTARKSNYGRRGIREVVITKDGSTYN